MRVRIKSEEWYLKINDRIALTILTKNKKERNFLNQIRRCLIENNVIDLEITNVKDKYIRNLRLNQEEMLRKRHLKNL